MRRVGLQRLLPGSIHPNRGTKRDVRITPRTLYNSEVACRSKTVLTPPTAPRQRDCIVPQPIRSTGRLASLTGAKPQASPQQALTSRLREMTSRIPLRSGTPDYEKRRPEGIRRALARNSSMAQTFGRPDRADPRPRTERMPRHAFIPRCSRDILTTLLRVQSCVRKFMRMSIRDQESADGLSARHESSAVCNSVVPRIQTPKR
jgi:hypothetical protein